VAGLAYSLGPNLRIFDVVSGNVVFFVFAWFHCCVFGLIRRELRIGDTAVIEYVLACQTKPTPEFK